MGEGAAASVAAPDSAAGVEAPDDPAAAGAPPLHVPLDTSSVHAPGGDAPAPDAAAPHAEPPTGSNPSSARKLYQDIEIADPNDAVAEDPGFERREFNALCGLPPDNPLRRGATAVITHRFFDPVVLIIILVNCVTIAMFDPLQPADSERNKFLARTEIVFQILFSIEMTLKIVALGFMLHPRAYLRDGWNRLDFVIVLVGFVTLFPGLGNFSAVRIVRVLRPLRTISGIPGMRRLVNSIVMSLPYLLNVIGLLFFVFFIFGILGIQLWSGELAKRCESDLTGLINEDEICSRSRFGHECGDMESCVKFANPNFGYTSFDNIGAAFLTIFQCITLEGWSEIMYTVQAATTTFSSIYFIVLILFGALFVVNLTLAVINSAFSAVSELEKESAERERQALLVEAAARRRQRRNLQDGVSPRPSRPSSQASHVPESVADDPRVPAHHLDVDDAVGDPDADSLDGIPKLELLPTDDVSRFFQAIVHSRFFEASVVALIVINTAILATEHHGMSDRLRDDLETANLALTILFTLEMILKLLALHKVYFHDNFNIFDMFIVIVSWIELLVTGGGGGGPVTAFRALRLLRVFKLVRSWKNLRSVLLTLQKSTSQMGYMTLLLVIFIFMYAVMGMQLFGGKINFEGEGIPRHHFDNLGRACVTVFQVLTKENWNTVMFDAMRATTWVASFYFVSLVVVGDFILVNVFIAILLQNFGGDLVNKGQLPPNERDLQSQSGGDGDGEQEEHRSTTSQLPMVPEADSSSPNDSGLNEEADVAAGAGVVMYPDEGNDKPADTDGDKQADDASASSGRRASPSLVSSGRGSPHDDVPAAPPPTVARNNSSKVRPAPLRSNSSSASTPASAVNTPQSMAKHPLVAMHSSKAHGDSEQSLPSVQGSSKGGRVSNMSHRRAQHRKGKGRSDDPVFFMHRSVFLFEADSVVRRFLFRILSQPLFEPFVIACIVGSSILLAMENPSLSAKSTTGQVIFYLDIVFVAVFTIEMLVKIAVMGLVMHEGAYLRNSWNVLDCLVVLISLISLILSGVDLSFLKTFRLLRVLRPLRVVSRSQELKVAVNCLFISIPALLNLTMIVLLFWLIFGILGIQLFAGRFGSCNDPDVGFRSECTGVFRDPDGDLVERHWTVPDDNFDNIYNAMLTMFQLSTFEGWPTLMYRGVDATGPDEQPRKDYDESKVLFFISYVIVGCFFLTNMFVGVVIDNFQKIRNELSGLAFLSERQKKWLDAQRMVLQTRPDKRFRRPEQPVRAVCYSMCVTDTFDVVIVGLICLNILFMSMQYEGQDKEWNDMLFWSNVAFTAVFTLEAVTKILAFGSGYFSSNWDRFDFVVVIGSLLGIIFSVGVGAAIFRVFRVGRILRLVQKAKGLRALFRTLIFSLPSFLNLGGLLFLLFFIFAVLGVNLFGEVKHGEFINTDANFQDFGQAMLTLLRVATGEDWNGIMNDAMVQPPECDRSEGNCGLEAAPVYFVLFVFLISFLMLNLFVAVILENFHDSVKKEDLNITPYDIQRFKELWSEFDPKATTFIQGDKLMPFMIELGPPLGFNATESRNTAYMKTAIRTMDIPVNEDGRIQFQYTLNALAARVAGERLPETVEREVARSFPEVKDQLALVGQFYEAKGIVRYWRGRTMRTKAIERVTSMPLFTLPGSKNDGDKGDKGDQKDVPPAIVEPKDHESGSSSGAGAGAGDGDGKAIRRFPSIQSVRSRGAGGAGAASASSVQEDEEARQAALGRGAWDRARKVFVIQDGDDDDLPDPAVSNTLHAMQNPQDRSAPLRQSKSGGGGLMPGGPAESSKRLWRPKSAPSTAMVAMMEEGSEENG